MPAPGENWLWVPSNWTLLELDRCNHLNGIAEEVSATPTPLFGSTFGTVKVY